MSTRNSPRPPVAGPIATGSIELPDRVGGRPALDFVNTVDERHAAVRRDYLTGYDALLAVLAPLGPALPAPVESLAARAAADPTAAQAAFVAAVALRESLYAVFAAALTAAPVPAADLEAVNAELCRATDHHLLRPDPAGGVRDGWTGADALDSPLWPLVVDAWDLLTTDQLRRVRECPADTCGWLFLDTSRSGTRRWCDMKTCGNRSKVRAHYSRQQDGPGPGEPRAFE